MKIKVGEEEVEVLTPQEVKELMEANNKENEDRIQKLLEANKEVKKNEPEEEPKKKGTGEDIDLLVDRKLSQKESAKSFDDFKSGLSDIKDIDVAVFEGLNPKQYSAIKSLIDKKKTLSEEDLNKLVEEKATEKAKKIIADNKTEKDSNTNNAPDYNTFKKY